MLLIYSVFYFLIIKRFAKERLENMKQKVAGMDKHEKVKEKEEVRGF